VWGISANAQGSRTAKNLPAKSVAVSGIDFPCNLFRADAGSPCSASIWEAFCLENLLTDKPVGSGLGSAAHEAQTFSLSKRRMKSAIILRKSRAIECHLGPIIAERDRVGNAFVPKSIDFGSGTFFGKQSSPTRSCAEPFDSNTIELTGH
jgi:hypothetical protein